MATLPTTGDDLDLIGFAVESQPGYTHKLDIDRGRVGGMTDEQDAPAHQPQFQEKVHHG
jgi:hypothetical protein